MAFTFLAVVSKSINGSCPMPFCEGGLGLGVRRFGKGEDFYAALPRLPPYIRDGGVEHPHEAVRVFAAFKSLSSLNPQLGQINSLSLNVISLCNVPHL